MTALRGLISSQRLRWRASRRYSVCSTSGGSAKSYTQSVCSGDFDLILIVRVDFNQHFDPARIGLAPEFRDEIERFGNHEATGARLLDGVADRVQANDANAGILKLIENPRQVIPARRMTNIDVDLLGRESGPEKMLGSVGEARLCKRKAGARAIDAEQFGLARAVGEDAAQCQKHSGERRFFAALVKSRNCGERVEMWFTMRSAMISTCRLRARTSSQEPRRGSTFV